MSGRIAVVDAENRFLRWEARKTIHDQRLVHRSAAVLLFDTRGRLVIQRRHRGKRTFPGYWDVSACGHVEESDYTGGPDDDLDAVYAAVARRELEEELGVRAEVRWLVASGPLPGLCYEWFHLFRAEHDGPYVAQPEEVEEIRSVTRADLAELRKAGAPITAMLEWELDWLAARNLW